MRKYTTEFLFHVRAIQFVVVQQPDLERVTDDLWEQQVEPSHIYMICRRPKISIVADETRFTERTVVGAFRVWHGAAYEEIVYRVPNQLRTADVTLVAEYPGTRFRIVTGDGEIVSSGNVAALMTSFGPRYSEHLNLEVLYVGQSFGFEGSRTAKDRLRSHETLQGIYAEALSRSPDMDIWLVLVSFEEPYIVIGMDPRRPALASNTQDNAHIAKVLNTPIPLQQEVNLTEAMLIRYFEPPYNTMFRTSFPNPAHRTYSECYQLDFHSVGVELETQHINSRLWSLTRDPAWLHIPKFPLHSDEHRASMFGIFE